MQIDDRLKINNISEQMIPMQNFQRKRQIFTSKLRNRPLPETRTFSQSYSRQSKNKSSQIFRQQSLPLFQDEEQKIKTFDKLQLQDFIKVFITGNDKLSQQRQQEIIKSLNGTWFKNLNNQRQINNLYNNLPLKKQRDIVSRKKVQDNYKNKVTNVILIDNYKHPNLFPKRKSSPKMLSISKTKDVSKSSILTSNTKIAFSDHRGLNNSFGISLKSNESSSCKTRRFSTGFLRNKSMQLSPQSYNNCFFVKKMPIHD